MALIFAVFFLSLMAILYNRRELSIGLALAGIVFTLAMFWHHATSALEINW